MPAQDLVRRELRERLDYYKREISHRRATDLRDAIRQAADQDAATRARRRFNACEKWRDRQAGKKWKWWRIVRLIIIADPCAYCGADATVVDHVMPAIRGGSDKRRNLVPACKKCNSAKGSRTPQEWKAARLARGLDWPPTWEQQLSANPAA